MTTTEDNHYGARSVKRSLLHFVLGKGVSAATTLAVLVIIIRQLEAKEFAVYTSMHAMVLIVGLLSSFGTNAVLMRFLPELRALGNFSAMYRLLFSGITARALSYAIVALLLFAFAKPICDVLNMSGALEVVRWYCLVGFLRINATFATWALESLLWQRETQYSTALVGLCKLAVVAAVARDGGMDLRQLVAIELIAESMLLFLLLGAAIVRWRSDKHRRVGDLDVLAANRARYKRFAFWSYLQNLTSIGTGSAPNRLFVSYFLPTAELVATYGAIDRFTDFVRRYEPLRTFVGLIRPVLNARFAEGRDFASVVDTAGFLFRTNLLVLIAPMVIVAVAGNELFAWVTAGRYPEIGRLFLAFYAVAVVASVDNILDILVKVLEETRIYTVSNIVLSGSIVLAIPLVAEIGLWGLAIANCIGLLLSLLIVITYVKRQGHAIRGDWWLMARVIAYAAIAIAVGHLALSMRVSAWTAAAIAETCFLFAVYLRPPMHVHERVLVVRSLTSVARRLVRFRGG